MRNIFNIGFVGLTHLGLNYLAASSEKGFNVTALDYTHGAIKLIKSAFEENNYSGEVLQQDFFELDCNYNEKFELMLEHTFFCAINPKHIVDSIIYCLYKH